MIFLTLGTQNFQLNRIINELDQLKLNTKNDEEIYAQIGYSTYIPKNFKYTSFLEPDEFNSMISKARIIISHGGTSSIIKALRAEKKLIVIPRRPDLGEHVDSHQEEIVEAYENQGAILVLREVKNLEEMLNEIEDWTPKKIQWHDNNELIEDISQFLGYDQ